METSIALQEPFSYSVIPIILLLLVLFLSGLLFLLNSRKRNQNKAAPTKRQPSEPDRERLTLEQIKKKYLGEIAGLERGLMSGRMQERECYQNLSLCARRFVSDVTGVELTKMTLMEIERLGMPTVKELIGEFYAPEFAPRSGTDAGKAIEKTKRMIEEWK